MNRNGTDAAAERAAFRAFVREHHPDRGGDAAVFAAGLTRFGRGPTAGPTAGDPDSADPDRTDPDRTDPAGDRYDRPIEVVAELPLPVRVGVALIRTWHRRRRPRVR